MKKILILIIVIAASIYEVLQQQDHALARSSTQASSVERVNKESTALQSAYQNRLSDLQIHGEGIVIKVLSDDRDGSRHQKFILRNGSGQTVLVAHNIDLAPRIDDLRKGDRVVFYGEYEWSSKGGVIHWTHKDPRGKHASGWLKHNGKVYQ